MQGEFIAAEIAPQIGATVSGASAQPGALIARLQAAAAEARVKAVAMQAAGKLELADLYRQMSESRERAAWKLNGQPRPHARPVVQIATARATDAQTIVTLQKPSARTTEVSCSGRLVRAVLTPVRLRGWSGTVISRVFSFASGSRRITRRNPLWH